MLYVLIIIVFSSGYLLISDCICKISTSSTMHPCHLGHVHPLGFMKGVQSCHQYITMMITPWFQFIVVQMCSAWPQLCCLPISLDYYHNVVEFSNDLALRKTNLTEVKVIACEKVIKNNKHYLIKIQGLLGTEITSHLFWSVISQWSDIPILNSCRFAILIKRNRTAYNNFSILLTL